MSLKLSYGFSIKNSSWSTSDPVSEQGSNMSKRILSVSYDESLLSTRQMLLQQAGYEVTSALGFPEALAWCKKGEFEHVLMGHSIPREDKQVLVRVTRMVSQAPVLSIRRPTSVPLAAADYSVKSEDGPEALVAAVDKALGQDRR